MLGFIWYLYLYKQVSLFPWFWKFFDLFDFLPTEVYLLNSRSGICGEQMNLNDFTLAELKKLQDDVAVAIFNYEKRKKAKALAAVEEAARAAGFSLKELLGDQKLSKAKTKAAPKYANPADPSQTWTGRGRKPKWVEALLASGKTLEDLTI